MAALGQEFGRQVKCKSWDAVKVNLRKKLDLESDHTWDSSDIFDQGEE